MGAEELRNKLIKVIHKADEPYLNALYKFVERKGLPNENPYQDLQETAQQLIAQSLKESELGLLTPHEEVMAHFRKKYNLS